MVSFRFVWSLGGLICQTSMSCRRLCRSSIRSPLSPLEAGVCSEKAPQSCFDSNKLPDVAVCLSCLCVCVCVCVSVCFLLGNAFAGQGFCLALLLCLSGFRFQLQIWNFRLGVQMWGFRLQVSRDAKARFEHCDSSAVLEHARFKRDDS